ncbi:hypothetical protein F5Y01DRAFT_276660 [Xylaria sp. FL0043]|nr:hypothetical protein F5Y01DRAFT_276660 [Xylaria sp. FL0043]
MTKRQRTEETDEKAENSSPVSGIQTDLGLLRRPEPAAPRILVAGMVAGTDEDIPEGMDGSGGINFLVGKRLVAPGSGTLSYPCGILQSGEKIQTCASRVVLEQTGLVVKPEAIVRTTENVMEGEHYVTFFVFCGFPEDKTPIKTHNHAEWENWHWSTLEEQKVHATIRGEEVYEPVFDPLVNLYDESKTRSIDWDREPGVYV